MKIDLVGQRFNKLIVQRKTECPYLSFNSKRRSYWLCNCDCGNQITVQTSALKSGRTKSCGCYKKEFNKERGFNIKGLAGLNRIFQRYKTTAKRRSHIFSLDREQFKNLTSQNCFYCGGIPSIVSDLSDSRGILHERIEFGRYVYNGLDRIDSSKGYTIDNVVPCCLYCNRMKNDLSLKDFLDKVDKIHRNKSNIERVLNSTKE